MTEEHGPPMLRKRPTEAERFRAAFAAELAANPDDNFAPGPTALNRRMNASRVYTQHDPSRTLMNRLNGRLTALRRELMLEAGFTKTAPSERWKRDHSK